MAKRNSGAKAKHVDLIAIEDKLDDVKYLLNACSMAAECLPPEHANPLCILLNVTHERADQAGREIGAYRAAQEAGEAR